MSMKICNSENVFSSEVRVFKSQENFATSIQWKHFLEAFGVHQLPVYLVIIEYMHVMIILKHATLISLLYKKLVQATAI